MNFRALELINRWSWFHYLPNEAKISFAEQCHLLSIEKETILYRHNAPVTLIYGVLRGAFRISLSSASGGEMTIDNISAGVWFPHFIPRTKPVYFCNCTCTSTASVIAVSYQNFVDFGSKWPQLYRGMYSDLADRGALMVGRLELLSLHALNVRLAVYLLRLLAVSGVELTDQAWLIDSAGSQAEIANRVGAARQRVNGILKDWEKRSVLIVKKSGIVIIDRNFLYQISKNSGFDVDSYLSTCSHYGS